MNIIFGNYFSLFEKCDPFVKTTEYLVLTRRSLASSEIVRVR